MGRRRKSVVVNTKFHREYKYQMGNFTIERGEVIKIEGEHGTKFKFDAIVTNTENGKTWVDCFELYKGTACSMRSFTVDRIRRIPKKRPRKVMQNVN